MQTSFDIPYTRTRCIRVIVQPYPATWRVSFSREFNIPSTWIGGSWGFVEIYWRAVR